MAQNNDDQNLTDSYRNFYSLLQTIDGIVWEADAYTLQFTFVSNQAKDILGYSPQYWLNEFNFWENHIHPEDKEKIKEYYDLKNIPDKKIAVEYRMINADGGIVWIKDNVSVITDNNKPVSLRGIMLDITATKQLNNLEYLEKDVLELNSQSDVPVQDVLSHYLVGIEKLFPKMLCSILQNKNNRLYNWASPSLPLTYIQAIESLPIDNNVGSCGTAAYLKQMVIVSDIEADMRWLHYKDLALSHNLRACWSHPIINSEGQVIATLGMYYHEPRTPNNAEIKVIERVTSLLKIILENRQKAEIIKEINLLITQSQELAQFGNWRWDVQNNVVTWSDTLYTIYGLNKTNFNATFEGYQELLHPDDRERVYNIISNVLHTKQDVEFEEKIVRPNGEVRYLRSWGKLKSDANGLPIEMIGACLDITDSRKTQEALKETVIAIENQNKKLREIAWMQSHGVRAPLTNIMGLIGLINNLPPTDGDDIENHQLLKHLLTSANELDGIIKTISQKTDYIDQ